MGIQLSQYEIKTMQGDENDQSEDQSAQARVAPSESNKT